MAWYITYDYGYNHAYKAEKHVLGEAEVTESYRIKFGEDIRTSDVIHEHPLDWLLQKKESASQRREEAERGEGPFGPAHGWHEIRHLAWFTEVPDKYEELFA